jgi:hypothetical protein
MKLIIAALVTLLASTAQAADEPTGVNYGKALMTAYGAGLCQVVSQPTQETGLFSSTESYDASTESLHRCQYNSEMHDSGCALNDTCLSYEDWTRANPAISPELPREEFLSAFLARRAATNVEGK